MTRMAQNFIDKLLHHADTALRTLCPPQQRVCSRPLPNEGIVNAAPLTDREKQHVAGLMRVNHAGEVCAQALYQGQAMTARLTEVRQQMEQAAAEEVDHLAWCERRLLELNSRPSVLNPLWYLGSLCIGALAGLAGDKWSLGFVAETERQVGAHLRDHLDNLPAADLKTKAILQQMHEEESHHAAMAEAAGAAALPSPIQAMMSTVSKLMTKTSYYL
ncbi:demethoxyubiquinone hydroxylase family protein [Legionella taurinensis]|uniref:3-demethoxyubiquinol 3-hydroxylase n=2 Tax=Legionella taurinensis TaxID=70611 RepID=A0A3A5LFR1_9GAMM|nr:2-polyprenyl-3-methyl-6-methoxy-1,4-benzoquinone monooxygenase [Legionella taurinensis]MDX1836196.1 2-polyprenyl-3-methyl-6-methoxy-1,4-benzoquinone monooxygenase [Legionella taurinensis]PUT42192.1 demethoxyubiquinone hydroxylase family protein [Legionella taurinensis]PUT44980.1 demethoxyubiquinone hydroxylase family protein [Legionella taurinensis]PUT48301.1 demethoxyubiquinone hydroxylase family protein [Legionella taurinensis]PUT49114.1 demethoxyubiquinone hydroxylase family protein [Leg